MNAMASLTEPRTDRLVASSILLGIGLGGFFDGIVAHQILQWHHLISEPVPPDSVANLELNTLADGLFHAATWVVTVVGLWVLVTSNGARNRPGGTKVFVGGLLVGWGGFNLVEGIVDHHVLGIHHVRAGPDELLYDLGFLAWGAVMLGIGLVVIRRATTARPSSA